MRVFGGLFVMVLFTAAVLIYLQGEDATKSFEAVDLISNTLKESGVEGKEINRDTAKRMITALEDLIDSPSYIAASMEGLREISTVAAQWAHNAPSPSADLHMSVCIRAAADELREYGVSPAEGRLSRARIQLAKARDGLMGRAGNSGPTDGISDRLHNLERAQRERYQEINELGN